MNWGIYEGIKRSNDKFKNTRMNWEKCEWIGENDNKLGKLLMNLICIKEYDDE